MPARHLMSVLCILWCLGSAARAEIAVTIGYLEQVVPRPPILSNLDAVPENEGLAGAEIALKDNATTGRFLKHGYGLTTRVVEDGGDLLGAARDLLAATGFLVVKAPAADVVAVADLPEAKAALIFNAAAPETSLRDGDCRRSLFHTLPSRAMLSDALAQFAVKKKWTDWVLISGTHPGDIAFAEALQRSARKFGLKVRERKSWAYDADMRRNAAAEVPLFTQDLPDHDLIVISDEPGDFGRYVMYHTWRPRPVAGSEGLVPAAWSAAVEQHGAAQLQNRFKTHAGRAMRSVDYAAWAALRSVGEAVTRTNSGDVGTIRDYLLSDKFKLAGFKGRPLSYRRWNGQLRQPIALSHPRAIAALAPIEGFLHRRSELDTLGLDEPESACGAFKE